MDRKEFVDICNSMLPPNNGPTNQTIDMLITEYCIDKGKTKQEEIDKVKQGFMICMDNGTLIAQMVDHFRRKFEVTEITKDNEILKFY